MKKPVRYILHLSAGQILFVFPRSRQSEKLSKAFPLQHSHLHSSPFSKPTQCVDDTVVSTKQILHARQWH
jgi:hypothetical protein